MTIRGVIQVLVVTASAIAAMASVKATPPKTYDVDTRFVISGSADDTWTAIVDLFAERQWKIDKLDKASGLITTDTMLVSSTSTDMVNRFADCGSVTGESQSDKLSTTVSFNIVSRAAGNGTVVTVNASFRRRGVSCASTGGVEEVIRDGLRARVKAAAAGPQTKDGRKTVAGSKPLSCAITAPDVGLCFLAETECITEAAKVGIEKCEQKLAGSCFTATRTLEQTKSTVCAVSIKDCEARREATAKDADFTVTPCGVYRAK